MFTSVWTLIYFQKCLDVVLQNNISKVWWFIFPCFCLLKYIPLKYNVIVNYSMTKLWRIYPFFRRKCKEALKNILYLNFNC